MTTNSPASSSSNPGPAVITGNDYLLGGDASGGVALGNAAASTIGFYGATPVAQRATTSLHSASVVSASTYITVGSNLAAFAAEVASTLAGLGIWV